VAELRAVIATAASAPLDDARRPRGGRPRRDGRPVRYKAPANGLAAETVAALTRLGRERQLMYRVWLATGLRRGELSRVTVAMFDAQRRRLDLPGPLTKNGRPAALRLPPQLAADLVDFTAVAGRVAADRLLAVPDSGATSRLHRRVLVRAGVPHRTPAGFADVHALRKTANRFLRRHGVAARLRQRFLRHAAADLMTAVYDDERGREMRPVVRLMARLDAAVCRPPADR
jgi:integrase